MKLQRDTVKEVIFEADRYWGTPSHLKTAEAMAFRIDKMHETLAKVYSEEDFEEAADRMWNKAWKFPEIPDFHKGRGGAEPRVTMEELG